jgi:hypothetical protein
MVERRILEAMFTEAERAYIEFENERRIDAEHRRIRAAVGRLTESDERQIEARFKAEEDLVDVWSRFKNVSLPRAVVDLASAVDLISTGERSSLLRQIGEDDQQRNAALPYWNREAGHLWFGGEIVRTVRGEIVAPDVHAILDEFQAEGWRERVANPLKNKDAQKLREAIRSLNKGLAVLFFRADGSSSGIVWQLRTPRAPPAHRP